MQCTSVDVNKNKQNFEIPGRELCCSSTGIITGIQGYVTQNNRGMIILAPAVGAADQARFFTEAYEVISGL